MLEVQRIAAAYGSSQVLFDVDLSIGEGEVVALLGRNGMGKSTTVRCIAGLMPLKAGSINLSKHRIDREPSFRICQQGIALVPEGRQIFPNLTVAENLICNGVKRASKEVRWTLDRVLQLFPRLGERMSHGGNNLSGGEQQMLAIGRALMTNPRLLILDEATEGLAPIVRDEIWRCIEQLKGERLSILLIDKNLEHVLQVADRQYVIEKGRIVWSGVKERFLAESVARRYLEMNTQPT